MYAQKTNWFANLDIGEILVCSHLVVLSEVNRVLFLFYFVVCFCGSIFPMKVYATSYLMVKVIYIKPTECCLNILSARLNVAYSYMVV